MTSTTNPPITAQTAVTEQHNAPDCSLTTILQRATADLSSCQYLYPGYIEGAIRQEMHKARCPDVRAEEMQAAVKHVEEALRLMWGKEGE